MILTYIGQPGRPCPVKFKERMWLIYLFICGSFNISATVSNQDLSSGLMIIGHWIESGVEGMIVAYFR